MDKFSALQESNLDKRLISLVGKLGFPVVMAIFVLAYALITVRRHEEDMKKQIQSCMTSVSDFSRAAISFESSLNKLSEKMDTHLFCDSRTLGGK